MTTMAIICNSICSRSIPLFSNSRNITCIRKPVKRNLRTLASSFHTTTINSISTRPNNWWDISENSKREKPMCLYHSQKLCNRMDDPQHMETFNHSYSRLNIELYNVENVRPQQFDYFLVLDLEGKVEILEFPVVMIDAHTLKFVDAFHRFVYPTKMNDKKIKEYIEGKYGKLHLDGVWHETAIPFPRMLQQFEKWLINHQLWDKEALTLNRAAFVTCGNWDVKTKIPQQCETSELKLPSYFMEWINIKDIYLNFYNYRASGMMAMLKGLKMSAIGAHHLGLDDVQNIARVLQRMLADGALMQITARKIRNGSETKFLFKNRI